MSKTVKVRIAVAVDSDGNWTAAGYSGCEADVFDCATQVVADVRDDYTPYWVTAELPVPLPIPEATEVAGKVET